MVDYYVHIYNVKIQETDAKQHYLPSKVVIKKRKKVTEADRNQEQELICKEATEA